MERQKVILIVDDEERIRRLLRMYLERENFVIDEASDGETAIQKASDFDYDLILLDVILPGIDGMKVCTKIRQMKSTPVIMLSANGEERNRVQAFEFGADDFVNKPFSPREVIYRVIAVLRRSTLTAYFSNEMKGTSNDIIFPHLKIEHNAHRVIAGNLEVNLTPKEFELLRFLAKTPDKVYSREELFKEVWQYNFFGGELRTVDTHVKRLREKLSRVSSEAAAMIFTVWGFGYKLLQSKS